MKTVVWPVTAPWSVLSELAFHGLASDYVRALYPYTEADPAAPLTTTLLLFGNGAVPHPRLGPRTQIEQLSEVAA